AYLTGPLTDDQLRPYPSLCLEDTARNLPKRDTWTLDNQQRLVPFYLWRRAKTLGQKPAYFWVWLVMLALTVWA
ncbi:hypothetical protein B4907_22930, partial [Yersinia kristensenii]